MYKLVLMFYRYPIILIKEKYTSLTNLNVHILFILCQDVPSVTSTVIFNPNHCVLGIKNHCYKLLSVTVLLLYVPCNFSEKNTLFILIVMVL